jgi:hypothetical protein
MSARSYPYTVTPETAKEVKMEGLTSVKIYIEEVGEFCYGVAIFGSGEFVPPHYHNLGEIITIDQSSDGPGFAFVNGIYRRADPGTSTYIPGGIGNTHAWCAGEKGFIMHFTYPDTAERTGRYLVEQSDFHRVTPGEEGTAQILTPEDWADAVSS